MHGLSARTNPSPMDGIYSCVASLLQRVSRRLHRIRSPRIASHELYAACVRGQRGIEIGGPSAPFRAGDVLPLYDEVGSLDNCNFAAETVWSTHDAEFKFSDSRPAGKTYVCEGSDLRMLQTGSFDFVLSSHNLEHFANPVKALYEWKRVLRPGGALVLVLPYYRDTFDHRRTPTSVDHMFADYESHTDEDDLTHLAEILAKHDLSRDPAAGSPEQFRERSTNNLQHRCLHHHVFDEQNSRELLERAGFQIRTVGRAFPFHLALLATVRS
jgi:SAM-dependent methyltransferase